MKKGLIYRNGTYGATIAGRIFTTYEGAEAFYKKLSDMFAANPSYGGADALRIFEEGLVNELGYSWQDIEELEEITLKAA